MADLQPIANAQVPAYTEERTWRFQGDAIRGQAPYIQCFREVWTLDANQAPIGDPIRLPDQYIFQVTPETVAALPPQFQPLAVLLPDFFDWLVATRKAEAQQSQTQ